MKTVLPRKNPDEIMIRLNIVLNDDDMKAIGKKMSAPVGFGWRPNRDEVKKFCHRAIEEAIEKARHEL
jgi:hypothetical protein